MKKLFLPFFFVLFSFIQSMAQSDSLITLLVDKTVSFTFPENYTEQKSDMRQVKEARRNGIIYSLFISDEYNYLTVKNGLQLDSLYDVIIFNTGQIYAGEIIETDSYKINFGELRGKYLQVKSKSTSNPYIAEYYIVCVTGRIFVFSTTYLSNYSQRQIKEATEFYTTIKFNESLSFKDQLSH